MNKKWIRKMQTAAGGNLYGGGGLTSLISIPLLPNVKEIRSRLYNGVNPAGYEYIPERVWDALNNKKAHKDVYRDDQWATYLQIPEKERHSGVEKLQPARYRPSIGNTNGDVYRMPLNKEDTDVLIQRAQLSGLGLGKNMVDRSLAHYFGDHTVGRGHDKKGEYISYYDKYDLNQFTGGTPVKTGIKSVDKWLQTTTILPNIDLSLGIGKPFEIYDRIYLDDYYGVPEEAKGGNFLPEVTVIGKKKQGGKMNILEFLKNGSGIHIKKKNRGKFTSYCGGKVTDECIRKAKTSGNPTLVKRATFADNARHFKHKKGGKAFVNGVSALDSNPNAYKQVKKKVKMRQYGGLLSQYYDPNNPNSIRGIPMQVMLGRYYDEQQRLLKEKLKAQQDQIEAEQKAQNSQRITDYITNIGSYLINSIGKKSNKSVDNGSPASTLGTSSLLTNIGNTGSLSSNQNPMNFFGLPKQGPSLSSSVVKYYDPNYWKSQL